MNDAMQVLLTMIGIAIVCILAKILITVKWIGSNLDQSERLDEIQKRQAELSDRADELCNEKRNVNHEQTATQNTRTLL